MLTVALTPKLTVTHMVTATITATVTLRDGGRRTYTGGLGCRTGGRRVAGSRPSDADRTRAQATGDARWRGTLLPGQMAPLGRTTPPSTACRFLASMLKEEVGGLKESTGSSPEEILARMVTGKILSSPFPTSDTKEMRSRLASQLEGKGFPVRHEARDRVQPVLVRLLGATLRDADDPVGRVFYTSGVAGTGIHGTRIGCGPRFPRTPAVYEEKTKWKLAAQAEPGEEPEAGEPEMVLRSNYPYVRDWSDRSTSFLRASGTGASCASWSSRKPRMTSSGKSRAGM